MRWEPLPFNIGMAKNRTMVPKDVVKSTKIQIFGIQYVVNLVVLEMKNKIARTYHMLLGRPWLQDAKINHDLKRDKIFLNKGKRKFKLKLGQGRPLMALESTPLYAKTCNMEKRLEEDEEKELMRQNLDLISLFMMDLANLADNNQYSKIGKQQNTWEKNKEKAIQEDSQTKRKRGSRVVGG